MEKHERFRGMCFCDECCRLMNRKRPPTATYKERVERIRRPPPATLLTLVSPDNPRGSMTTALDEFGKLEVYARIGHDNIFLGLAENRDEGARLFNEYASSYNRIQYNKRGDNW